VTVPVMLFTRDLRLTDNPARTAAARGGAVVRVGGGTRPAAHSRCLAGVPQSPR
jgi:deoxyribodipyrimidine photolyase